MPSNSFVSISILFNSVEKISKRRIEFNLNQIFLHQNVNYRSQKRRNNQQEAIESVSEGFVSPVVVENSCPLNQDVSMAGPSKPKSPRIEGSLSESLRASLKEEITPEIRNLLVESQREMLRLLKPELRENVRENTEEETEKETRSFYTPTKSVRINSTQNNDTNVNNM